MTFIFLLLKTVNIKANGVKGWGNLSEQEILGTFGTSNGIDVGTLLAGGSFTLDLHSNKVL